MMKQTTLLLVALTMSSMAFAQAKSRALKPLTEKRTEVVKSSVKTTEVTATSSRAKLAQEAALKIGNGARAEELEVMMNKVPEMVEVIETLSKSEGMENEKAILAYLGRSRGTDQDAQLDNAGVKKVAVNLHQIRKVFGERGDILVAEMRKSLDANKTSNVALRDGLNASKGRKLSKAEADKVVREDLPKCE